MLFLSVIVFDVAFLAFILLSHLNLKHRFTDCKNAIFYLLF